MELSEKLQELRKEKGLTQEELAEALFVSRTAISKWESGRGVPNIESLKAISKFFSVSIDELLSGEEILKIADEDNKQKEKHTRDLVFGLLDCSLIMFLFLPFFGQKGDEIIKEVSLLSLTGTPQYIKIPYLIIVFGGNAEIAETSGTLLFQPVPVGADVRIVVDIHCSKDLMTWRLRTLTLPPSGQKEIILYYLMR